MKISVKGYLSRDPAQMVVAQKMAEELETYTELTHRVIDQSERRVIHGESVPASEKIVFIFEPHTDIIVKDHRDTLYGHKLCLTGGSSNLITDCGIVDGNPADSTLTQQMLDVRITFMVAIPLRLR